LFWFRPVNCVMTEGPAVAECRRFCPAWRVIRHPPAQQGPPAYRPSPRGFESPAVRFRCRPNPPDSSVLKKGDRHLAAFDIPPCFELHRSQSPFFNGGSPSGENSTTASPPGNEHARALPDCNGCSFLVPSSAWNPPDRSSCFDTADDVSVAHAITSCCSKRSFHQGVPKRSLGTRCQCRRSVLRTRRAFRNRLRSPGWVTEIRVARIRPPIRPTLCCALLPIVQRITAKDAEGCGD
jgi:hypothetical protein